MNKTIDRFGRSAYGVELTMKNVNHEGKFVLPLCPQEQDVAELIVFLVDSSPEIKLDVVRANGVLIRTFDSFITSCLSAGVSFENCLPEILGSFLIDAARKRHALVWHGVKRRRQSSREIFLDYRTATKFLSAAG